MSEPIGVVLERNRGIACHRGVRVQKLLWPKKSKDFKKACKFESQLNNTYAISGAADFRGHLMGPGVCASEIMGPLVPYFTYDVWVDESKAVTNDFGSTIYPIVYAQLEASYKKGIPRDDLRELCELCGIPLDLALCAGAAREHLLPAKEIKKLFGWAEQRGQGILSEFTPFSSERVCDDLLLLNDMTSCLCAVCEPNIFRLFPQYELSRLAPQLTLDLARRLRRPFNLLDVTRTLLPLCFPHLSDKAGLPALKASRLHTLARHFHYPATVAVPEEAWRRLCLSIEYFQKAVDEQKRQGHTFGTLEELAECYLAATTGNERADPNAQHFWPHDERPILTRQHVVGEMRLGLAVMLHNRVIYRRIERQCQNKPRDDKSNRVVVYYPGDEWIMLDYVSKRFKDVLNTWRRDVHADGCHTEEDVRQRIRRGAPPCGRSDVGPQWHNEAFRACWKSLDERQRDAVVAAVLHPVSVITGQPGCGKTEVFRALTHLFETTGVVPLTAYGRVASMIRKRVGRAWTFHRAQSMVERSGPDASEETQYISSAETALLDEFSLDTTDHLARYLTVASDKLARIVFAGDINQMGAIGSGTFSESLVHFARQHAPDMLTELNIPHRFLPNFGAGLTAEQVQSLRAVRPTSPSDPMSVVWNMDRMLEYKSKGDPFEPIDLVFAAAGDDDNSVQKARFGMLPDCNGAQSVIKAFESHLHLPPNGTMSRNLQAVTKLNRDCNELSKSLRAFIPECSHVNGPYFVRGEKVTFLANAYLSQQGRQGAGDVALDFQGMQRDGAHPQSGDKRRRDGNPVAKRNRRQQAPDARSSSTVAPRSATYRGLDSDDVFNGDIRVIEDIYEVDKGGHVRQTLQDTKDRHVKGSVVVAFTDGTQLFLDRYDTDKMASGLLITSKKMQGSECDRVILFWRSHTFLFSEELYTTLTRGIHHFDIVSTKSRQATLTSIQKVLAKSAPKRRERFADRVPLLLSQR